MNDDRTRTNQPTDQVTEAEARAELEKIQTKITVENFQQMAQERSDCGSFANGGDLGLFGRGAMMQSFEEVAFGLEINTISDIVKTDSGLHLIMRYI
jgi:parvulin-like peptidyl-prolyl isomerase